MMKISTRNSRHKGFTMIELLIVIAIVGLIAAIAYPNYTRSVAKTNRSAAKTALLQLQLAQERWRSSNPSYTNVIANLNAPAVNNYVLAITAAGATNYTITATAVGNQLANDGGCSPLSVNENGPVTPNAAAQTCWSQ